MRLARLAAVGLAIGVIVGFAIALLRTRSSVPTEPEWRFEPNEPTHPTRRGGADGADGMGAAAGQIDGADSFDGEAPVDGLTLRTRRRVGG